MASGINNRVMMFYGASPIIFERAKRLRRTMTPSEKELWKHLAKRQLGVKFRRQHPMSRFIADFYSHECLLVVELDGKIHDSKKAQEYDAQRTAIINELGIRLIRFKNEEVLNNIEGVIEKIKEEVAASPSTPRSPGGEAATLPTESPKKVPKRGFRGKQPTESPRKSPKGDLGANTQNL